MPKTTGKAWKDFVTDARAFPKGSFMDAPAIVIEGLDEAVYESSDDIDFASIYDHDRVRFVGGTYYEKDGAEGVQLDLHFRRWQQRRRYEAIKGRASHAKTCKPVCVSLDSGTLDVAKTIGDGNVSLGIRKAVEQYVFG